MSRLLAALPDLAVAAACWAARLDRSGLAYELQITSEALARERSHVQHLEQRVAELRANRDSWMAAHDEKAAEAKSLREEVETLKKPIKPPKGGKPVPPKKPPKKPC